eukprot:jgi/Psemu1/198439/e_gw1.219.40.1
MPPGFKRSRALWDATTDGGWRAWVNAICYELQPIRLSKSNREQAVKTLQTLFHNLVSLILGIPRVCKSVLVFASRRTWKQWMVLGIVVAYYYFIRWVHEALDAGPVVLILTALTVIFTIGLSDDENRGGLSAYSVFNRGFEQLMGSVDADSLLAQHVGGGAGMMMMNMNNHGAAAERPPPRDEDPVRRPPPANENDAVIDEDDDERDNNNDDDDDDDNNNNNNHNHNRARKSGKKARRRDLDQRRELRRQREAAVRMGLDGAGDNPEDALAMQRLIEEQIAADNNQR